MPEIFCDILCNENESHLAAVPLVHLAKCACIFSLIDPGANQTRKHGRVAVPLRALRMLICLTRKIPFKHTLTWKQGKLLEVHVLTQA